MSIKEGYQQVEVFRACQSCDQKLGKRFVDEDDAPSVPSKVQCFLTRGTRVNLKTPRRKKMSRPALPEVVEQPNCVKQWQRVVVMEEWRIGRLC